MNQDRVSTSHYTVQRPTYCRWVRPIALLWVFVAALALIFGARSIADRLEQESGAALRASGITYEQILFSGRNATLTGAVGSRDEAQKAADVVLRLRGVATLDNQLTVAKATKPVRSRNAVRLRPTPLRLLGDGRKALTLDGGGVDDAQLDAFVAAAESVFGADGVRNQLVPTAAEPTQNWPAFANGLFPELLTLHEPAVEIEERQVRLRGMALSEAKRRRIEALAGQLLVPAYELRNDITVSAHASGPDRVLAAAETIVWSNPNPPRAILAGEPRALTAEITFLLGELAHQLQAFPKTNVEIGYKTPTLGEPQASWENDSEGLRLLLAYLTSLGLERERVLRVDEIPGAPLPGQTEQFLIRLSGQE